MFNHARTLLLNQDARTAPGPDFPGEEAVPAAFRAVAVPTVVQQCRAALFGRDPDRMMLNYRLRQYVGLLHATELAEHVLALDPRVTYDPRAALPDAAFGVAVEGGQGHALQVIGRPYADEDRGRLRHEFRVSCGNGGQVTVRQESPPASENVYDLDVVSDVPLNGRLRCLPDRAPGAVWAVTATARPTRTLPDIVEALRNTLTEDRVIQLFGAAPAEPYLTYRNLWATHAQLPYALGGLLMAVVLRTNEAWRKEA